MSMKSAKLAICAAALAAGFSMAATTSASAQAAVMKECGAEWSAAKAQGRTQPTDTWNSYLAECRVRKASAAGAAPAAAAPAAVAPAAVAPKPTPAAANPLKPAAPAAAAPAATPWWQQKPAATTTAAAPATAPAAAKPATGGRAAFVERERQCGSEWRANKVTLQAQNPGMKWPQYLSQCNTRIKTTGR